MEIVFKKEALYIYALSVVLQYHGKLGNVLVHGTGTIDEIINSIYSTRPDIKADTERKNAVSMISFSIAENTSNSRDKYVDSKHHNIDDAITALVEAIRKNII